MEHLPPELLDAVLALLDRWHLSALSRCSKSFHRYVTPWVYAIADIVIYQGRPTRRSDSMISTLIQKPHLARFIRSVEFHNATPSRWTEAQSRVLSIFNSLVQASNVRSFKSFSKELHINMRLPNLESLDCSSLQASDEMDWVRWHLTQCPALTSLRIHVKLNHSMSLDTGRCLPSNLALCHLRELSMSSIDVSRWEPGDLTSLRHLELRQCAGFERLLDVLVSRHDSKLTALRIQAHVQYADLFMKLLTRLKSLKELVLCLSNVGLSNVAAERILASTRVHKSTLRTLAFEVRDAINQPATAQSLSGRYLQRIVCIFPDLTSLGLNITLGYYHERRYRPFPLGPISRESKLQTLHLRGRYQPTRRVLADVRWIARTFAKERSLRLLVKNESSMKAFELFCWPHKPAFAPSTVAPAERTTHCF